jgi:dihydroorotate dehydrogenase (NAD+) catalytic subunit
MKTVSVRVGEIDLKNPIIAAPAEHMILEEGIKAAIHSGAGAVVGKSTNESEAAKAQLLQAQYAILDEHWNQLPWDAAAAGPITHLNRSGLTPLSWEEWLEQAMRCDRLARQHDCLFVPSIILSDLDHALRMARQIESAGFRVLELNIGTPYGKVAQAGAVTTEQSPVRVEEIVRAITRRVGIPVWTKITGQSDGVADLAAAAFGAAATAVVMPGRQLGMVPDLETMAPILGTSCGVGGYWNLPVTCHWLATTRTIVGPEKTLIATNGARNGRDALRMILAGASAVAMASEVMLRGTRVLTDAASEIQQYADEKRMTVEEMVGLAADRKLKFSEAPRSGETWRNHLPPLPPGNENHH